MVLKPGKEITTASPQWGKQPEGSVSTAAVSKLDCEAKEPAKCAFKLN